MTRRENLTQQYRQWDTATLTKALTTDRLEYESDAVHLMEAELYQRGLSSEEDAVLVAIDLPFSVEGFKFQSDEWLLRCVRAGMTLTPQSGMIDFMGDCVLTTKRLLYIKEHDIRGKSGTDMLLACANTGECSVALDIPLGDLRAVMLGTDQMKLQTPDTDFAILGPFDGVLFVKSLDACMQLNGRHLQSTGRNRWVAVDISLSKDELKSVRMDLSVFQSRYISTDAPRRNKNLANQKIATSILIHFIKVAIPILVIALFYALTKMR